MLTWYDLPQDIQERMKECQIEQYGRTKLEDFVHSIFGGFSWMETDEGHDFWDDVLSDGNIEKFYRYYPEKRKLILPEYETLYKKTFRRNRILLSEINFNKIEELGLEHILTLYAIEQLSK